jgi:hypothetical protein
MKRILLAAAALALVAGLAWAQNITGSLQQSQDPRGIVGVDAAGNIYFQQGGHILSSGGTAPVLSACVTGGSPKIVGTDFAGTITAGTTASTSCVVTFGHAFVTAPNCVVTWNTGPLAAMSWTTSTTALTITQTSNASSGISYMCTSTS